MFIFVRYFLLYTLLNKVYIAIFLYRFEERKVMLWGGFFFMVIGRVLCIPWGPDLPVIADFGREYILNN